MAKMEIVSEGARGRIAFESFFSNVIVILLLLLLFLITQHLRIVAFINLSLSLQLYLSVSARY